MNWRVYYDAERSSLNDYDCPRDGVLIVVFDNESCGRLLLHGFDFYMLISGQWVGADVFGVVDYAKNNLGKIELVLQGRSVTNEQFEKVMRDAQNDNDFAPKSARSRMETPRK